ncbi:MAG: caspase family protein [Lutibacter sp.]|uniref:caspase family protein n=1 Tax=Lutibacter sp. TaxID=1925666 RepID=UPI00385FA152
MKKLKNAYALLIGVKDDTLNTLIDAQSIYDILVDENLAGYDPNNILFVKGEESTRKHILDAFDKLQQMTNKDSSVFLYYTGHGGYEYGEYFIQPFGMSNESKKIFKDTWVSASDLKEELNKLKTKRLIFFLDCCHAAGMVQGFNMHSNSEVKSKSSIIAKSSEVADGLGQKIDNERGVTIISSCTEDQRSWQLPGENSLFTKCLVNALQGKHKTDFKDPYIRMLEVLAYIQSEVPKQAKEYEVEQNPYGNLQLYDNFTLCYVPKKIRERLSIEKSELPNRVASKELKEVVTSYRERKNANNLLLFIHGFSGEAADTFGIIPELLINDERMNGWDMKPLGYSQHVNPEFGKDIWGGTKDIDKISEYLVKSFKYKFDKYDRIAIVAHSLGGLIAQKAILNSDEKLRSKLSHLILLGSPNNGIAPGILANTFNNKYQQLSSDGNYIKTLRNNWDTTFKNNYPFKLKVAAATNDEYVSIESCLEPFEDKYCEIIEGNHLSMVKPIDEYNDCYMLIINTLTNSEFHNEYTNKEEINLALGKYNSVVKKLLPNANSIDSNGLKQLIFGLEGLDRRDEALQILINHPLAKNSSDIFGLIAGRYKRLYLNTFSKDDGDKSFEYYSKGLEIAVNDKNLGQIYYQAINLAFLSIVKNDNENDMKKYANQAIDAANASDENLWKLATLAEANLYIRKFDISKEYYAKSAKMAGLREKLSMHTNAYKAYTTLMSIDNPEDDFIKFLHTSFLM